MTNPAGAGDGGRHPGWREWDKTGAQPDSPFGTPGVGSSHLGHHQQSAADNLLSSGHIVGHNLAENRNGSLPEESILSIGFIRTIGLILLVGLPLAAVYFLFSTGGETTGVLWGLLLFWAMLLFMHLTSVDEWLWDRRLNIFPSIGGVFGFLFGFLGVILCVVFGAVLLWPFVLLGLFFLVLRTIFYAIFQYAWLWVPVVLFLWLSHYCA